MGNRRKVDRRKSLLGNGKKADKSLLGDGNKAGKVNERAFKKKVSDKDYYGNRGGREKAKKRCEKDPDKKREYTGAYFDEVIRED